MLEIKVGINGGSISYHLQQFCSNQVVVAVPEYFFGNRQQFFGSLLFENRASVVMDQSLEISF